MFVFVGAHPVIQETPDRSEAHAKYKVRIALLNNHPNSHMSCVFYIFFWLKFRLDVFLTTCFEFSVPQIEYPLGGSSKKGSHVYFVLIVAIVLLL